MRKYTLRVRYNAHTEGEIYYVIQRNYRGYRFLNPFKKYDLCYDLGPDDKYTTIKEAHQAIERLELAEKQVKEYNENGKV